MNILEPYAYGADGRRVRDVHIVNTRDGVQPHLSWVGVGIKKTFCGLEAATISRTWFDLAGCRRCRRSAADRGVASITDVD